MTTLFLGIDANGRQTFLRPVGGNIYNGLLAVGVEQTLTLPTDGSTTSGKWDVIISYSPGAIVWVAINGTAAAPTSSVSSAISALNPVGYTRLKDGDVIHFVTSNSTDFVEVTLYAIE